jgi:hypothetical protein
VTLQSQPSTANAHRCAYDTRGLLMSDVLTTTTAYSSRAYALSYGYDAACSRAARCISPACSSSSYPLEVSERLRLGHACHLG